MIIGSMEILVVNEDIMQDNGEVDLMHAQSIGVAGNNTYYNLNKLSSFDYIKKSQKNTLTDIVNRQGNSAFTVSEITHKVESMVGKTTDSAVRYVLGLMVHKGKAEQIHADGRVLFGKKD